MDIVLEKETWRARLAGPEDNGRLCDIMAEVDMQSDLHVVEERDPDFFALHRLHQGEPYTLLIEDKTRKAEDPERVVSFCSAVIRDGWLNGRLQRVAYVCDLRMIRGYRKKRILPIACREFFSYLEKEKQVVAFYSSSLHDNKGAVAARRFSGGRILCHFNMVNLPLSGKPKPLQTNVQKATEDDIGELADFLNAQASQRQFGYVFSEELLRQRLAAWPDLDINDFYLIRELAGKDSSGNIVACCAPWNAAASHLRKTRIMAYQRNMKWVKWIYNAEAHLRRFKPLPQPGGYLQQINLTHLEAKDDNPVLLKELIKAVFNDYRQQDFHFISLMMPCDSPLESALSGFRQQRIFFDLNCFTPGTQTRVLPSNRPGFEMAIH